MQISETQAVELGAPPDPQQGQDPRDYLFETLTSIFGLGQYSWEVINCPGTPDNGYVVTAKLRIQDCYLGACARAHTPQDAETIALARACRPLGPVFRIGIAAKEPQRPAPRPAQAPAQSPEAPPGHQAQQYQQMASQAAQGAPSGGTFKFGRNKGDFLMQGSIADLEWYAGAIQRSINDPEKARYQAGNRAHLAEIQSVIAAKQHPQPTHNPDVSDDIPF